jgi:hypothetical protein
MNITHLPDGSLHIRVVPWGLWITSAALIGVWLLFMVVFGFAQANMLACRRVEPGQVDCLLTRSILGFERSREPLRGLTGATVQRSSGGRGSATYRVDIAARSGVVSLTSYTSSGFQDKQAIADRINRFVADQGTIDLTLSYVDWPAILFSLLLLVGGVLLSPLATSIVSWRFDRLTGALTIERRRALGRKTVEYRLDQIRSTAVERSRRTSRVALRLVSGEVVPLTSYSDSGGWHAKHEAVRHIQEFLGLSSTANPSDEAQALFQRGVQAYFSNLFGSKDTAVRLFHQATQLDPNHQLAWMFLASNTRSIDEKRAYLERIVAVDPISAEGRRAAVELQALDGAAAPGPQLAAGSPALLLPSLPGSPISGAVGGQSVVERLLGVITFQAPSYRQIADDPTATPSAGAIVLLVAALAGFIGGMTSDSLTVNGRALLAGPTHGVVQALIEVCAGLVSWLVGSLVGAFVATTFFRGRTNTAEMLRVLGYTSVFRLLWVFPCGFMLSWLLSAVGTVIAMREAAEFDTRKAAITAAIAWTAAFAVSGIIWLILTFVVIGVIVSTLG